MLLELCHHVRVGFALLGAFSVTKGPVRNSGPYNCRRLSISGVRFGGAFSVTEGPVRKSGPYNCRR